MSVKSAAVKGFLDATTGYAANMKAADRLNDNVGGKRVGRLFSTIAQLAIYAPLTEAAADLTSQSYEAFQKSMENSGAEGAVTNGLKTAFGAIATAHMATRTAASVITVVPNAREWAEEKGLI